MKEKKEIEEQKEGKNELEISNNKITLDTMTKVGKKVILANREYLVAPINVGDMKIIDGNYLLLPILRENKIDDVYYAVNVTDENKAKYFFKIVERYVTYEDGKIAMTKELVEEHNWSFSDIRKFLEAWLEISD